MKPQLLHIGGVRVYRIRPGYYLVPTNKLGAVRVHRRILNGGRSWWSAYDRLEGFYVLQGPTLRSIVARVREEYGQSTE